MKETNTLNPYKIGTDHAYAFHVKNRAEDTAIDITGFTLSWRLKKRLEDLDADALLTKTTVSGIAIAGTFSATPASNAQRATVTILDTDTDALVQRTSSWELKRTDAGLESVLAYGTLQVVRGVHRS